MKVTLVAVRQMTMLDGPQRLWSVMEWDGYSSRCQTPLIHPQTCNACGACWVLGTSDPNSRTTPRALSVAISETSMEGTLEPGTRNQPALLQAQSAGALSVGEK